MCLSGPVAAADARSVRRATRDMIRRDLLIRSKLPPDAVLRALADRGREWRESVVPAELRTHGVYGVQIQTDGSSFRMYSEPTQTDRFELRCKGVVLPEGTGSIIRGTIRQDNPPLWIGLFVAVLLAINVARAPSWLAVGKGLGLLAAWAVIGGILVLVAPRQSRHEAEAAEFERILESAAWPPGAKGSVQVAV